MFTDYSKTTEPVCVIVLLLSFVLYLLLNSFWPFRYRNVIPLPESEKYREREPESEDIDEELDGGSAKQKKNHDDDHERHHEELKKGASDGNGGVEARGHDPADYALPEKYTYGGGDEYNF